MKRTSLIITAMLLVALTSWASSSLPNVTETKPRIDGKIRFGVISDVHVGITPVLGAGNNLCLQNAFDFFSDPELGIEQVVVVGDLSDFGSREELDVFRRIRNQHLHIPLMASMGNHEANNWEGFEQVTGSRANDVRVIGGYYFITVSPGAGALDETTMRATRNNTDNYEYIRDWLQKQVAKAKAASGEKPVFVFVHHPLSEESGLNGLFDSDPRVIYFSGHIHLPNNSPRGIRQDKGFTEVNTAVTGLVAQGLLVEADEKGNVKITTHDFNRRRKVQEWEFNVNKPLPYTDAIRKPLAKAPEFASGARINMIEITTNSVVFTFKNAIIPEPNPVSDIVFSYRGELIDKATGDQVEQFRFHPDLFSDTIRQTLQGLEKNTEYEVRIYASDAWQKESTGYLSTSFKTLAKNIKPPEPIEIALRFDGDLSNGKNRPVQMYRQATNPGLYDTIPRFSTGVNGQAIELSARNFVQLDNETDLIDYGQSFSVGFWINIQSVRDDGEPAILSNRNVNRDRYNGFSFRTFNNNGVNFISLDYSPVKDTFARLPLTPTKIGAWTHLAATFDYDNNRIKVYVDGLLVQDAKADLSCGIGGIVNECSFKTTFLGSSPWNYSIERGGYNGSGKGNNDIRFLVDDFVMSSRVFSQNDVATLLTGAGTAILKNQQDEKPQTITPLYADNHQVLLNGTWKFKYIPGMTAGSDSLFFKNDFDVSRWSDIIVPGHWDLQGFSEPIYGLAEAGLGLYVTSFNVPDSYRNRQLFIKFEGVLYGYDVYVNGRWAGSWASSYHAASFNISDFVEHGKQNKLAVRVSTRTKGHEFDRCDNWALAGIFRDVSIFSVPDTYVDDYTITTHLHNDSSAKVIITTDIKSHENRLPDDMTLQSLLYAPDGKLVGESVTRVEANRSTRELTVKSPRLWTAETPTLYQLKIRLLKGGTLSQEINQKVGIREISIVGDVLMLNNKPLKLKGVNYHDLAPETGKHMTEEQLTKDLLMMKKANVNYIRTSHNPPERRKLELCDSLGIYVSCEVPFTFGREHLNDLGYEEILVKRANATVLRDKNHPSIIMWTIGNENPITPITLAAGTRVKEMDPTRPISYAGTSNLSTIPDFADIYAPHYPNVNLVKNYKGEAKRPVIYTEYAHSLGLSFGNQEDLWREIFRNKSVAGGAVWHFQDQGLLLKAGQPVDTTKLAYDVWLDSVNYYKATLEGADGVVYADRTPQPDYWQLRKVYAPVQIIERELTVTTGKQVLYFTAYNQLDFTNLNDLRGVWKLYKNSTLYKDGNLTIDCAPHDTITVTLPVELPQNAGEDVWLLQFAFSDKNRIELHEHTVSLVTDRKYEGIKQSLTRNRSGSKLKIKNDKASVRVSGRNFIYDLKDKSFSLSVPAHANMIPVIEEGILARAGREPIMSDVTCRDRHYPDDKNYFWDPYLLKASDVSKEIIRQKGDGYHFRTYSIFPRVGEGFEGEKIAGEIDYAIDKNGGLTVRFDLKPVDATGVFLNAGVSFVLAPEIENIFWLGDGPYPSVPDKHTLSEFGIYRMKKGDLHFNGNRHNVEMFALTDDDGNGMAIVCDRADIAVEVKNGRIVVSYNALISGVGNKKTMPDVLYKADQVEQIKGVFIIIPLSAGNWPQKMKDVLGYPDKSAKVSNPFYYSLDSSK